MVMMVTGCAPVLCRELGFPVCSFALFGLRLCSGAEILGGEGPSWAIGARLMWGEGSRQRWQLL